MHAEGLLAVSREIRRQAEDGDVSGPVLNSLDLSGNPVASQQAEIRAAFRRLVRHLRVDTYNGDLPQSDHVGEM